MQLTFKDLIKVRTLESSALNLINQLLHNKSKAYLNNGGTYWEFGCKLQRNIAILHRKLNNNTFQFSPYLKRTKIMKNKKVRDLYLPTWPDRIVERWLSECLNIKLHNWFSNNSYAYRYRDYCLDTCQWNVLKSIKQGSYIIKRDITNCFYTVDHKVLIDQIDQLIDKNDYLHKLICSRIEYDYYTDDDKTIKRSNIGVPFGSSIACILANIHLTKIDRAIEQLDVNYFRYADDFLIITDDKDKAKQASEILDNDLSVINFKTKASHAINIFLGRRDGVPEDAFESSGKFKYLGLEFTSDNKVRLGVEKQRKIINLVKRELSKYKDIKDILSLVQRVNNAMIGRIRSVAIIDYYLKHITDEAQLKVMDTLISELIISHITGKPFKKRHYGIVSYKSLRKAGLISLVHRRRLHVHGHLNVDFMNLYNSMLYERYDREHANRKARINQLKIKKLLD